MHDILNKLFSLHRFGIKPGLERTQMLLAAVSNPHEKFRSVHVAGTNGKGSVCSLIASVLMEAGYKTGLYTSPHIRRFNERIKINGKEISDTDLLDYAELLMPEAEKSGATFFEITTVMAFKYFADQKVDIAVVETGMGGRFDSTNVVSPLVSVITGVSMDHTEYLGNTLGEIAFEKAGIIKPGTPAVLADVPDNTRQVFADKALAEKASLTFAGSEIYGRIISYGRDLAMNIELEEESGGKLDLTLPLPGPHQLANAVSALAAVRKLQSIMHINDMALINGFKNVIGNTGIYARIQKIAEKPDIIIDVAHNEDGIRRLVDTITNSRLFPFKWNIIFGAMEDKNIPAMIGILEDIAAEFYFVSIKNERACSSPRLAEIASAAGLKNFRAFDDSPEGLNSALNAAAPIIITGSFYLLDELSAYEPIKSALENYL